MNAGFNNNMAAIAHFIVNFERMLTLGTTGIIKEIERNEKKNRRTIRISMKARSSLFMRWRRLLNGMRILCPT